MEAIFYCNNMASDKVQFSDVSPRQKGPNNLESIKCFFALVKSNLNYLRLNSI